MICSFMNYELTGKFRIKAYCSQELNVAEPPRIFVLLARPPSLKNLPMLMVTRGQYDQSADEGLLPDTHRRKQGSDVIIIRALREIGHE